MTGIVAAASDFTVTGFSMATQTLRTASQSLDVLELYVRKAKLDQADAHVAHRKTSRLYMLEEASRQRTLHQERLAAEMYATPQRKALFDANFAELSALFD